MTRVVLAALVLSGLWACTAEVGTAPTSPGDVVGQVFVVDGVPSTTCLVLLEGTPHGGRCDEAGRFEILGVPAGRWNAMVYADAEARGAPQARLRVGVNAHSVTQVDAIKLSTPGRVAGRVLPIASVDLASTFVATEEGDAISIPNAQGAYLLEGVAPGKRTIALLAPSAQLQTTAQVSSQRVTTDVDFDVMGAVAPAGGKVTGVVQYQAGGAKRLAVELIDARDGHTVKGLEVDNGAVFTLELDPNVVLVRARVPGGKALAWVPPVLVRSGATVELKSSLVVPTDDGDLDGDGLPNASDPDLDGDGHLNVDEPDVALQWDPSDWRDTDGDGVPDRFDLQDDRQHLTSEVDSDLDGRFDFEDDCPLVGNPGQEDADGDGVGDLCDQCPGLDDFGPLCPFPTADHVVLSLAGVSLVAGECSAPLTLELRDRNGAATSTLADRPVVLTGAPATLALYADPQCTSLASSARIAAGTGRATFYLRAEQATSMRTFGVSVAGLFSVELSVDVRAAAATKLGFLNAPLRVEADRCSPLLELGAIDEFANPSALAADEPVQLTPQLDGTFNNLDFGFFTDEQCANLVDGSAGATVVVPAGGGRAHLFFKKRHTDINPRDGGVEGVFRVEASSIVHPVGAQQLETVYPSRPTQWVSVGDPQHGGPTDPEVSRGVAVGACSRALIFRLADANQNAQRWPWNDTVDVSVNGDSSTTLYGDAACATPLAMPGAGVTRAVPAGTAALTYFVRKTQSGQVTVSVSSQKLQGVGNANGAEWVNAFTATPTRADLEPYYAAPTPTPVLASTLCSPQFTLRLHDEFGNEAGATDDLDVRVSALPAAGAQFFTDSSCATPVAATGVHFTQGESNKPLYVRSRPLPTGTTSEPLSLQTASDGPAGGSAFTAAALAVTSLKLPDSFAFQSAPASVVAGACTAVQLEARLGGVAVDAPVDLSLDLGGNFEFHADASCLTGWSEPLHAGTHQVTLYVRSYSANAGAYVSARPSWYPVLNQLSATSRTIAVQAGAPTQLVFTQGTGNTNAGDGGVDAMTSAGSCSSAARIELRDPWNNTAHAAADTAVQLTVNPSAGVRFFGQPGCAGPVAVGSTTVTITSTAGVQDFWVASTNSGSKQITAAVSAGGFNPTTTGWYVYPREASVANLLSPLSTISRNLCTEFRVQPTDLYANPNTYPQDVSVPLFAAPAGNATFYTDPMCNGAPRTAVSLPASSIYASFYVKATGSFALTVGGGTLQASAPFNVTVP